MADILLEKNVIKCAKTKPGPFKVSKRIYQFCDSVRFGADIFLLIAIGRRHGVARSDHS